MADFEQIISSPTAAYEEGLAFFRGQGVLNRTLLRIIADLERNGIDYAVIGAIALNQHGYKRFTEDVDILLTKDGLRKFQEHLVGLGYHPAFPGATKQFRMTAENVRVEVVTTGEYPGDGLPVVFPDPSENVEEIDAEGLIHEPMNRRQSHARSRREHGRQEVRRCRHAGVARRAPLGPHA